MIGGSCISRQFWTAVHNTPIHMRMHRCIHVYPYTCVHRRIHVYPYTCIHLYIGVTASSSSFQCAKVRPSKADNARFHKLAIPLTHRSQGTLFRIGDSLNSLGLRKARVFLVLSRFNCEDLIEKAKTWKNLKFNFAMHSWRVYANISRCCLVFNTRL